MAKKPLLPKNFIDDEPLLIDVMVDGFAVGLPYVSETTGETKYKYKACGGIGETCFYIEQVAQEIQVLREKAELDNE